MNDLQKNLDQVFHLISAIPVSGEGVELMAAARERLRTAYKLAETARDEGEESNG